MIDDISLLEKNVSNILENIEQISDLIDNMEALNINLSIQVANERLESIRTGLTFSKEQMKQMISQFQKIKCELELVTKNVNGLRFEVIQKMMGE